MSTSRDEILQALKNLLRPEQFRDYCPNGMQVEGKAQVQRVVTGVTACQALIDRAIEEKADLLLVHHGYFWKGENECITGIKKKRVQALLDHNISLLAYHLPLDVHPEFGNNAALGKLLGFNTTGDLGKQNNNSIGLTGELEAPMSGAEFSNLLAQRLGREPLHIQGDAAPIRTVAWCTGAAQNFIELAYQAGVDAYVTGEASEQTVHFARETGMHFYAAGHHATERYGVQAVAEYLATQLDFEHQFIDVDNPV